jgi:hypothetical protein
MAAERSLLTDGRQAALPHGQGQPGYVRESRLWSHRRRLQDHPSGTAFSGHISATITDQNGGHRTPVISSPSQRVTVMAVTGQSVILRLRRSR